MSYLLDTCVISELVKKAPERSVLEWVAGCDEKMLYLSVLTIGELEKGVARLPGSARKRRLEAWVRRDLPDRFQDRLLPVDLAVAARWGALIGGSESRGVPLPVIDSLIAATGLAHDLIIVTRNTADLERCGARCFDPWKHT